MRGDGWCRIKGTRFGIQGEGAAALHATSINTVATGQAVCMSGGKKEGQYGVVG